MTSHTSKRSLTRREFLRRAASLGGAAALVATAAGCKKKGDEILVFLTPASETPAPAQKTKPLPSSISSESTQTVTSTELFATPTKSPEDVWGKVAFVMTDNRAEGVRRAVELLGINPVLGKSVFLKPNYNSADPTPGSTHPEVLTALVQMLKEMGAGKVTVGDRSGMGNTRRVMERIGVFRLADEIGFDTIVFDDLSADEWLMIEPTDSHWERGFPMARPCLEADALVQTCCLKTHRYGGHFTLSLKNSVGMVAKRYPQQNHDFMQELHSSPHQRRMIAEINTAYKPALIVLDGVEAFISGGPDVGEKVTPQVVLAGTDRIAIDAVGVALLRFHGCKTEAGRGRIFEQEQIARAVELGLGIDNPEKIEFLTGDAESVEYSEEIREVLLAG